MPATGRARPCCPRSVENIVEPRPTACTVAKRSSQVACVNAVCPGYVMTPMSAAIGQEEMIKRAHERVPALRCAEPEEIAHSVVWLLSDQASYMNGAGLVVDGGLMLSIIPPPAAPAMA
jgi:NAD(P)-dependent dehydrogenase (short-subunit alcohol dehydrogenase family)